MQIRYDHLVLQQAYKIAASPTALQKDLVRFLHDEDVLSWYPEGGPSVSYLAPETKSEIMSLLVSLPRRSSNNKFKKRNG